MPGKTRKRQTILTGRWPSLKNKKRVRFSIRPRTRTRTRTRTRRQ